MDEERLRRCMVNLVTNACQAMQPPGGELTVTSRLQDGVVMLSVADTGCGIPADQQEKVFEPLFSTKSFGVGLGLPIVKQVVEQHGGCIKLHSTPGRGTILEIALPVSPPD
ncbi:MAG: sensor histidine kinase [Pirellulaceae bacterium]